MSQAKTVRVETAVPVESPVGLRAIIGDLADDASALIRGEIELARSEMEQKLRRAVSGLITLFGAMLLAYAGLIIVFLAGAQALNLVIPLWAALLCIGIVVLAVGGALALMARKALNPSDMVPQRTVNNVSRDARVVKENVT